MTSEKNRKCEAVHVSIVIAAHNEADTISDVVQRSVKAVKSECEVIVIDDGSTDQTAQQARQAGATVIRLWPNRGKGAALRAGIARSVGDWLLFIDADGQDDPAEIPLLMEKATEGVALVNGSRFMGELREGAISVPNWFGNVLMTLLLDLAFQARITDSQAGFRLIRGEVARSLPLRSDEYEIETEMLAKVLRRKLPVVEVPVTRYRRAAGVTDFRRIRNGLRILATIARERVVR
jgi:glycosyltransferase involved in cell wall biosynthesis